MHPTIRPLEITDIPALHAHLARHGRESGRDGDLIFAPYETTWDQPVDSLRQDKLQKWSTPIHEPGWERAWAVVQNNEVFGELKLVQQPALKTALHRTTLMMGIERPYRGKGLGSKLIDAAISWAKKQPSLDWIQLYVFDHNEPAKKLYRKHGFEVIGVTRDLFRVHGNKIDDVMMVLNLKV